MVLLNNRYNFGNATYVSVRIASFLDVLLGGKGQHNVAGMNDLIFEEESFGDGFESRFVLNVHLVVGLLLLSCAVLLGRERSGPTVGGWGGFLAVVTCNVTVQIIGGVALELAKRADMWRLLLIV